MTVLQGGTRRRRRRSPRAPLFALLLLAVAVAVLLWALDSNTSGPAARHTQAKAHVVTKPPAPPPPRPTYATRLVPAAERVNVKIQLPLKAGLLFDVRTGGVLWERDPDQEVPIASLTKMMTALLVAEHAKPTDRVLITRTATHFSGSGVGLLPQGKRVPLLPLLYGLLLPSGNDAAIALAQHVGGTQQHFIAMMNHKAGQLGLGCTHFNSVSGIVDQDNHSCAAELALIAHLVLTNPLLSRIVASRSAILPFPIKGGKVYLYNNNPLLVTGYPGPTASRPGSPTRPASAWSPRPAADGPGWGWCCCTPATRTSRRRRC